MQSNELNSIYAISPFFSKMTNLSALYKEIKEVLPDDLQMTFLGITGILATSLKLIKKMGLIDELQKQLKSTGITLVQLENDIPL